ncbi:GNAT family N-acetyltransferase [Actinoplanes sp. RD1]|uniref:GNAT family N-acetyltransferase n=1 Tax=Actinoplanes sp. RD1 TaxID=3064538 RepID=UPI0027413280|nr:GNAT family N-acetyltransferase [Actinoplanes sp. RD1]
MPRLERLSAEHADRVLRFEVDNREYFTRSVADRGDDYFAHFAERHAALLAEQERGLCHFHVLVDDDGSIMGRFNLYDVADGEAELGYRVAQRCAGRGVAQDGVRRVIARARDEYGLRRLRAGTGDRNVASQRVLRATGFVGGGQAYSLSL